MNDKLKQLYSDHWNVFSAKLNDIVCDNNYIIKPANPLLLSINDVQEYENADIRLMIIGQENNGWEGVFYNDIDKIQSVYKRFAPNGQPFAYRDPFKKHFNLFTTLLKNKFPDKKVNWLWNNLIKVAKSKNKGTPPSYIINIETTHFKVLAEEIKITKPNIILFYTGPYYDKHINFHLPSNEKIQIEGYNKNELIKLNIENVNFAFRTYHPGYLNRIKSVRYNDIYKTILNNIKF